MSRFLDALRVFSRPAVRIASQLDRLNTNFERYLYHSGVPQLPSPADEQRHAAERAVPPLRDEWEIAIEEEVAARREAADREIAASKGQS